MNRFPIQPAKVQPPAVRDDTLTRDRLLDWLSAKIHDRVILILADAGYGKTTLLADFSRRTRLRTLWYRLDDDDRDWIAFLNHLVAAGREHDPGFAPTTAAMLADMSVGGPTRDSAIDVFMRELPGITEHGAVLILDDFHLVDDSPDVRLIARELVARAPERLSIVFASRRPPAVPLAKLRATGEVAELGTDDLRFDAIETQRLFSETYGRALEPDVLAEVFARTEGWAASLQLVQAALRDRSPAEIRRFVRSLSGGDQELYDYLAEEVVGDLATDLQEFLMRTAILQTVTDDLAAVVSELDSAETNRLTLAAERLTLLTRRSRSSVAPRRYHPLVREFLETRLRAAAGDMAVAAMHRRVADAAAATDWRIAAHHYREAGDLDLVASVVADAIPEIMGAGQYGLAAEYVEQVPAEFGPAALNLIRSRDQMQHGNHEAALGLSRTVLTAVRPGSSESDHALLNLLALEIHAGEGEHVAQLADQLSASTKIDYLRDIAVGAKAMLDASRAGRIDVVVPLLLAMAQRQRGAHPHYFGVTMLNLAVLSITLDDPSAAVEYANEAIESLEETSSFIELSSALMAKAIALSLLGQGGRAGVDVERAAGLGQIEALLERAELADSFDDPAAAWGLLESVSGAEALNLNDEMAFVLQSARFLARRGRHEEALSRLHEVYRVEGGTVPGQKAAQLVTEAYVHLSADSPEALRLIREAIAVAKAQRATRWYRAAVLLNGCADGRPEISTIVSGVGGQSPSSLTFVADQLASRLQDLDDRALATVADAASLHPGRWRFVLRRVIEDASIGGGLEAARLLETIGARPDIKLLRSYARKQRKLPGAAVLGRRLARNLADPVRIEDLDRVSIHVGLRQVPGSAVRRKVLALLCFLLTRPEMASTRDQCLEALWPDLNPADAVNSLNQTVYFLRRILEEEYVDDLSPGYLHHDSDLIWLDKDLVSSRSNECRALIKAFPEMPSPDQVQQLVDGYTGRFALDFEYEEWAAPYRDWLHASFLEIVERALTADIETGHFLRGIRIARRALDVDPNAEQVEVSLLRLYRSSGAHSAAAEQYAHYAEVMREELGEEPPPLEAL